MKLIDSIMEREGWQVQKDLYYKRKRRLSGKTQVIHGSAIVTGRVCPSCNLRRAELEFKAGETVYANCRNCWPKWGKKR